MTGLCLIALGVVGGKAQGSNSTLTKELILKTGTYQSLINTGAQSSNYTYTLPITTPTVNQVLTATAVSGTAITFGWSSAGGGGGVTYGPSSTQNTLTPVTTKLFDIGYASASGNAAGAQITSSTTSGSSSGLQVSSVGTTSVVGAMLSATGGTTNYALVVPASSGNVGIGNAAPGSLLSVGSSGQLTVNTSGNLSTSGTVTVTGSSLSLGSAATAPGLRFYEPSAGGTESSSFVAGAQAAVINYTLPTSQPTANQILTAQSISGTGPYAVVLTWANPSGAAGVSFPKTASKTVDETQVAATPKDVASLTTTVDANRTYGFEALISFSTDQLNATYDLIWTAPVGTTFAYSTQRVDVGGNAEVFTTSNTTSYAPSPLGQRYYRFKGTVVVGGTAGTFKLQVDRSVTGTGGSAITVYAGSYFSLSPGN